MPIPGKPNVWRRSLPYGRLTGHGLKQWTRLVAAALQSGDLCEKPKALYGELLLDGRCSISNNIAENIARPYAVGRKNFLFHDTVKGARASSIILQFSRNCKTQQF